MKSHWNVYEFPCLLRNYLNNTLKMEVHHHFLLSWCKIITLGVPSAFGRFRQSSPGSLTRWNDGGRRHPAIGCYMFLSIAEQKVSQKNYDALFFWPKKNIKGTPQQFKNKISGWDFDKTWAQNELPDVRGTCNISFIGWRKAFTRNAETALNFRVLFEYQCYN